MLIAFMLLNIILYVPFMLAIGYVVLRKLVHEKRVITSFYQTAMLLLTIFALQWALNNIFQKHDPFQYSVIALLIS